MTPSTLPRWRVSHGPDTEAKTRGTAHAICGHWIPTTERVLSYKIPPASSSPFWPAFLPLASMKHQETQGSHVLFGLASSKFSTSYKQWSPIKYRIPSQNFTHSPRDSNCHHYPKARKVASLRMFSGSQSTKVEPRVWTPRSVTSLLSIVLFPKSNHRWFLQLLFRPKLGQVKYIAALTRKSEIL